MVIVDEHPITRWGITHHLTRSGWHVLAELGDLAELPATYAALRPDVVVVDPAGDVHPGGVAALRSFLSDFPGARVLAFTVDVQPVSVEAVLECGCLGVVPKSSAIDGLVAALRDVAAGERHLHPRAIAALMQRRHVRDTAGEVRALSGRELEVLRLVAEGRSNAHIAADLGVSDATVKTHVAHVLRKLQAVDRAHAVGRALRLGLLE